MSLEITGKLVQKLQEESGEGRNGTWRKRSFVIETFDQYPKKVCITLWGDKIDILETYQENQAMRVGINIESREYNGRWYTDVKAWRLDAYQEGQSMDNSGSSSGPMPPPPPTEEFSSSGDDDLPF